MSLLTLTITILLLFIATARRVELDCPAGTFRTRKRCKPCPKGSFQTLPNQTFCESCPPGTFQPFRGAISDNCIHCLPGTFAPSRSARCKKCRPGTDSREKASKCTNNCPPGEALGFFGEEACIPCGFGLYRGRGDGKNCLVCPNGFTTPTRTATSTDECIECPAGFQFAGSCFRCFPGSFRELGTDGTCKACPPGSFTNKEAQSKCKPCPRNTFKTGSAEDEFLSKCRPCPPRTTSVSSASFCRRVKGPCPKNFFVRNNGDCEFCSKGYFRNRETNECEKCPKNSVSPGGTTTRCKPCGENKITFEEDVSQCRCRDGFELRDRICRPCRPGSFIQFPRKLKERCLKCPGGHIAPNPGSRACTPCPRGLTTDGSGQTKCIRCPRGTFWDFTSANDCINPITGCPPGFERKRFEDGTAGFFGCFPKVCPPRHIKTVGGCRTCKRGERAVDLNTFYANCERCKTRFEVSPGRDVENCTKCKRGFVRSVSNGSKCVCGGRLAFGRRLVKRRCKLCPKGTFNPGISGTAKCFKCPPGTTSKRGARECSNCPRDTFSRRPGSSKCKPCPSGTFTYGLGESKCIPLNDH